MVEQSETPKEREIVELLKQCANLFPAAPKKSKPSVLLRKRKSEVILGRAGRSLPRPASQAWANIRNTLGVKKLRRNFAENKMALATSIATAIILAVLTIAGGYRWSDTEPATATTHNDSSALPIKEAKPSPLPDKPKSFGQQDGQSETAWPADNGGNVAITLDAAYIYVITNEIVYKIDQATLAITKIEVFALPKRVRSQEKAKSDK